MKTLMELIYEQGLIPWEDNHPDKQEYDDLLQLTECVEKDLKAVLEGNAAEMFREYQEYVGKSTELEKEECFTQGLSLGIRLAAEAFLNGRKRKTE